MHSGPWLARPGGALLTVPMVLLLWQFCEYLPHALDSHIYGYNRILICLKGNYGNDKQKGHVMLLIYTLQSKLIIAKVWLLVLTDSRTELHWATRFGAGQSPSGTHPFPSIEAGMDCIPQKKTVLSACLVPHKTPTAQHPVSVPSHATKASLATR